MQAQRGNPVFRTTITAFPSLSLFVPVPVPVPVPVGVEVGVAESMRMHAKSVGYHAFLICLALPYFDLIECKYEEVLRLNIKRLCTSAHAFCTFPFPSPLPSKRKRQKYLLSLPPSSFLSYQRPFYLQVP